MNQLLSKSTTVFGPPGTGKTTYLARQAGRAADTFGVDNVAIASLTRTAAYRIASKLTQTDVEIDLAHVGTLHALCYRMLDRPELVAKHLADFCSEYGYSLSGGRDMDDPDEESGKLEHDHLFERYELNRHRMIDRKAWTPQVERFASRYESWKRAHGYMDFTDLIEQAAARADEAPVHGAIFGDESQDWSRLELTLVKQWAEHCDHAVICGDCDQAMYSWRGASVRAFLAWSDRKIVLSQSYRVPAAVHAYSQRWVEQIATREPAAYRPKMDEETLEYVQGEVRMGNFCTATADDVVSCVVDDIERGREVMLLTTCAYMLNPLLSELRGAGIPFHNPYRRHNGKWNPFHVSKKRTSPAGRLLDLSRVSKEAWGGDARPWTWKEVYAWADALQSKHLVRGARTRLSEMKKDGRVVPFDELAKLIQPETLSVALCCDFEEYVRRCKPERAETLSSPLSVARRSGVRALEDDPKVIVGTIHSVKGGEADVVYLFPDLSPRAVESMDHDQDGKDAVLRQMYVGITRAKEKLVLCEPATKYNIEWLEEE